MAPGAEFSALEVSPAALAVFDPSYQAHGHSVAVGSYLAISLGIAEGDLLRVGKMRAAPVDVLPSLGERTAEIDRSILTVSPADGRFNTCFIEVALPATRFAPPIVGALVNSGNVDSRWLADDLADPAQIARGFHSDPARNLALLVGPVLGLLLLAAGRLRSRELAIYRSLGCDRRTVLYLLFVEYLTITSFAPVGWLAGLAATRGLSDPIAAAAALRQVSVVIVVAGCVLGAGSALILRRDIWDMVRDS
jgi:hypothetical protein